MFTNANLEKVFESRKPCSFTVDELVSSCMFPERELAVKTDPRRRLAIVRVGRSCYRATVAGWEGWDLDSDEPPVPWDEVGWDDLGLRVPRIDGRHTVRLIHIDRNPDEEIYSLLVGVETGEREYLILRLMPWQR